MATGQGGLAFFGLIGQRLNWLAAKQDVLARNIANADTPNYQARKVESFAAMLTRGRQTGLGMTVAHDRHIQAPAVGRGVRAEIDQAYEASPNGNTVVLEQQMMQVGEAALEHQMATQVYRKTMSLFRVALGRRG